MKTLAQLQADRANAHPELGYTPPAHRFLAANLDDADLHHQQVIPGARRAIPLAVIEGWRVEGLNEAQIALRINRSL